LLFAPALGKSQYLDVVSSAKSAVLAKIYELGTVHVLDFSEQPVFPFVDAQHKTPDQIALAQQDREGDILNVLTHCLSGLTRVRGVEIEIDRKAYGNLFMQIFMQRYLQSSCMMES
jgi:hypothetical protein